MPKHICKHTKRAGNTVNDRMKSKQAQTSGKIIFTLLRTTSGSATAIFRSLISPPSLCTKLFLCLLILFKAIWITHHTRMLRAKILFHKHTNNSNSNNKYTTSTITTIITAQGKNLHSTHNDFSVSVSVLLLSLSYCLFFIIVIVVALFSTAASSVFHLFHASVCMCAFAFYFSHFTLDALSIEIRRKFTMW